MARPLRRREHDRAGIFREKFVAAWPRTDQIFATRARPRAVGQADCLAPSVHFLFRSSAGLFLESNLRRDSRNGSHSIPISTICFAAASIPTSIPANAIGIPEVPDAWPSLAGNA